MEKINRTKAPQWLAEKYKTWGRDWKSKYEDSGKSSDFRWRQHNKKSRNDLVDKLCVMTQYHCSFCDGYPMGSLIKETIEHFRPKTKYPLLAYYWQNLFICCCICQQKGDAFDKALLKPDVASYEFDHYFDIEWDSGKIIPNIDSSAPNQQRAQVTIALYKLNDNSKPEARKAALLHFQDTNSPDIDSFSYRFFIKRGLL
jgi:uncharacterized protein (TIGR02646 family)